MEEAATKWSCNCTLSRLFTEVQYLQYTIFIIYELLIEKIRLPEANYMVSAMKGDSWIFQHLQTSFAPVNVLFFDTEHYSSTWSKCLPAEEAEGEETRGIKEPQSPWWWVGPAHKWFRHAVVQLPALITHSCVHSWPKPHHLLVPLSVF